MPNGTSVATLRHNDMECANVNSPAPADLDRRVKTVGCRAMSSFPDAHRGVERDLGRCPVEEIVVVEIGGWSVDAQS